MKAIKWSILNGLFLAAVYFGFFGDVTGARNVAVFLVWFAFAMSIMACIPAVHNEAFKSGPSVPHTVSAAVDLSALVVFLWFGWFVTAAAWLAHTVLMYGAFKAAQKNAGEAK